MLVSLNWLNEFIEHGLSVEQLAEKLTMSGTEVKSIKQVGSEFDHVIVGEVLSIDKHPNADKLHLPTIRLGKTKTAQVVCGAPNLQVGQKIAFAHPGAKLFMDASQKERTELKAATIRGVQSAGMICSERELGLGEKHYQGILVLPDDMKVGTSLATAACLQDVVFEVEITPNRGDCQSILGIAREVSAICGKPVKLPFGPDEKSQLSISEFEQKLKTWKKSELNKNVKAQVVLKAPDLCPRYSLLVLSDLQIGDSPIWMKWRLLNMGVRPINNIVDVTNYLMLELGEPLHAFDRRYIEKDKIIVRRAKKDEMIVTLDGQKRDLTKDSLLICDPVKAVALAGIMGGENSEVLADTADVLLEAAHFESVNNRRTSSRMGLRTEASARFEKFVDPELTLWSLFRSVQLFRLAGAGGQVKGLVDANELNIRKRAIDLGLGKIRQLLGIVVSKRQAADILTNLGFKVQPAGNKAHTKDWKMKVIIPSYRPDVREEADLVEEVARIIGYDKMGTRLPKAVFPLKTTSYTTNPVNFLRRTMKSMGFTECYGYSLLSKKELMRLGFDVRKYIPLANPLADFEFLRASLLPGLLLAVETNMQRYENLKLFDLGTVFIKKGRLADIGKPHPQRDPVEEPLKLAGIVMHQPSKDGRVWKSTQEALDLAKRSINELMGQMGMKTNEVIYSKPGTYQEAPAENWIHPGRQIGIRIGAEEKDLGWLGELNPQMLPKIGIDQRRVVYFQLDAVKLIASQNQKQFEGFSIYPSITMDLSFLIDHDIRSQDVREVILQIDKMLIADAQVIDVFHDSSFAADQQSMTWRIRYQSFEKTLEDEEVQKVQATMIKKLEKEFGIKVRK